MLAADERRVVAKWCWKGGAVARPDQRRILLDDPLLELPRSSRLGSSPNSLTEHDPGALVHVKCVMLAARRVQRAHQQRPRPLATRLLGDHSLHVGDDGRRCARAEPCFGEILQRGQPPLLEPSTVADSEVRIPRTR